MFERGFKTWCEEFSVQLRREIGLSAISPLDPLNLANMLEVDVRSPRELEGLPPDVCRRLVTTDANNWSAVTVSHKRHRLVVYNPAHSRARRNSDVMHEIAHILLDHHPTQVFVSPQSGYALRTHDKNQESEAGWLAGCLLLPRPALLHIRKLSLDDEAACEQYGVSEDLLRFRMNATGVNVQIQRARARRQKPRQ
jgi:Zn-dependent peptidase ImmA (M78 family)